MDYRLEESARNANDFRVESRMVSAREASDLLNRAHWLGYRHGKVVERLFDGLRADQNVWKERAPIFFGVFFHGE